MKLFLGFCGTILPALYWKKFVFLLFIFKWGVDLGLAFNGPQFNELAQKTEVSQNFPMPGKLVLTMD